MDFNKFTENSAKSLMQSETLAKAENNPSIDQEHIFYSLINFSGSLISELLQILNIDVETLKNDIFICNKK